MRDPVARIGTERVVAQPDRDQPIDAGDHVVPRILPVFRLPGNQLRTAAVRFRPHETSMRVHAGRIQ